jgi:hypothetical protein
LTSSLCDFFREQAVVRKSGSILGRQDRVG